MDRASADAAYFIRRSSEERAAADRASDPRARQSHLDLAERYAAAACDRSAFFGELPEQNRLPPAAGPHSEFRILP